METNQIKVGAAVRVSGYAGVAFTVVGEETEPGPTEWWDGDEIVFDEEPEPQPTGRILVVMVGDDRKHAVDFEDLSLLADEDFCSSCGQIGCGHGAL